MLTGTARRAWATFARIAFGRGLVSVEDRNYRNLLLSGFWFGPVDGGIFNFLPVFLARLGASASLVSLLTSGPSLLGIFTFIPGGAYAERQRDLVKVFVRMALIARVSYPLIALMPFVLPAEHVPVAVIVLWSLTAIPNAFHVPAWTAFMQKAVPPQQRARLNGARWGLMSLVSGIALAVFGYMLDRSPFPAGYQIVFLISFVGGVLNLYYFSLVKAPPFVPVTDESTANLPLGVRLKAFFRPLAESRPFIRFNIASLIYRLALSMPVGLLSIFWVQELHATDTWIGLRGTAGYATLVVGYFVWGRIANRMGHRNLLLICGAGLSLYPVLTALAPTMQWLLPVAALWGFTISGIDIGLFDMLLAICPEGRQPSFAAASNVLTSVAVTLGPLLGAALSAGVGIRTALLVIGGIQVLGTVSFRLLPSREQEGLA